MRSEEDYCRVQLMHSFAKLKQKVSLSESGLEFSTNLRIIFVVQVGISQMCFSCKPTFCDLVLCRILQVGRKLLKFIRKVLKELSFQV